MKPGAKRPSNPVKTETPPKGKPPMNPPGARGSSQKITGRGKSPNRGENDTINNLVTDMSGGNKAIAQNQVAIKLARQKLDRARRTFGMSKSVTIKGLEKIIPGPVWFFL